MVKNEDNEKIKYEENNDYIMEHEENNVIEYLESEKKSTLNILNDAKNVKKSFINADILLNVIYLIIFIFSLCAKIDLLVEMFSCGIVITNIFTFIMQKAINNDIKGHKAQLQFLEEKLKEETEKEMSKEKNKDKEREMIIENNEKSEEEFEKQIDEIDRQSCLYYDMGTHEKRLKKYYKLGMLKKYLNKISEAYNDSDVRIVENYLEEKGHKKIKGKFIKESEK